MTATAQGFALAADRSFKLTASISGTKRTQTRSGDGLLVELTDDEALSLVPGDVVVFETPTGCAPLEVVAVRLGVGEEGGGKTFPVPVIDGDVYGRRLAVAVPDCWYFVETSERADWATLSAQNFASWAATGG